MAWHEILAWVIIAVAFIAAITWLVKGIICPKSACSNCEKECLLRKKRD